MKKINLIIPLFFTLMFFSCNKEQEIMTMGKAVSTQPKIFSNLITWDQLPDKFKNAVRIKSSGEDENTLTTSRSALSVVDTYGPYGGSSGSTFSIVPFADESILGIGLGSSDGLSITTLSVWYGDGGFVTSQYEVGAPLSGHFYFYLFEDAEYIVGVSGRSSSFLNSLTITTNKRSYTAGGTGGTPFSSTVVPVGNWIMGFWGKTDNIRITQINFDVYCKPWQLLAGSSGRDIAIAPDGTAYMTNTAGKIYKMNALGNPAWVQLQGSDGKSIAANVNRVCMVNTAGKIYELLGISWRQLPGSSAVDLTIDSDSKIWMVNTAGKIYKYNDNSNRWELMPGSSGARIAAGYGMVWMTNTAGKIYKWNGASWILMTGSDAKDIAVGNDGSVWLTNTTGLIFNFNWNKLTWNELCGSSGSAIAANNKKAQLINSVGKIYKLTY